MTAYEINLNRHRHSYIHTSPNLWCLQMIPFGVRYLVLHMTRPYSLPKLPLSSFSTFPACSIIKARAVRATAFHGDEGKRENHWTVSLLEIVSDKRKSFESLRKAQWKDLRKRMKIFKKKSTMEIRCPTSSNNKNYFISRKLLKLLFNDEIILRISSFYFLTSRL